MVPEQSEMVGEGGTRERAEWNGDLAYECPIVFVGWYVGLIYIVIMILCRRKKIFIIVAVFVAEGKRWYNLYDTRSLFILSASPAPRTLEGTPITTGAFS